MPSAANRVRKLEQSYLVNGGVSPHDVTEIKKLLQESGIAVTLSDSELAAAAMAHFDNLKLESSVGLTLSPSKRLGSMSSCESDMVAQSKAKRLSNIDSRRRMSLAEYTALADDVRRQSIRFEKTATDEDDLIELARTPRRQQGSVQLIVQHSSEDDGDDIGSAGSGGSGEDFDLLSPRNDFTESGNGDLFCEQLNLGDDEKTVSLRTIQRRLRAVGVAGGMSVITGSPVSEHKRYRLKEKLSFAKLKEVIANRGMNEDDIDEHRADDYVANGNTGGTGTSPSHPKKNFRSLVKSAYAQFSAVMDAATLYRRLGGDPTDNHAVLSKDRILQSLTYFNNLGLSPAESRVYHTAISNCRDDRITFDAFLDVVAGVDMVLASSVTTASPIADRGRVIGNEAMTAMGNSSDFLSTDIAPSTAFLSRVGSGSVVVLNPSESVRTHSLSPPHAMLSPPIHALHGSTSKEITVHDAAAAFLINVAQAHHAKGGSSSVGGAERLRYRLSKALNEHIARTRRDCTFAKGLLYVLRLDVQLLTAFVLRCRGRIRNNSFSPFALSTKVLKIVDRILGLIHAHETCQVCFLPVESINQVHDVPKVANCGGVVNFMRLPQPPSSPPQRQTPTAVIVRGVEGLRSRAVSSKVGSSVGVVQLPAVSDGSLHKQKLNASDASAAGSTSSGPSLSPPWSSSQHVAKPPSSTMFVPATSVTLRKDGFTAKNMRTVCVKDASDCRPSSASQPIRRMKVASRYLKAHNSNVSENEKLESILQKQRLNDYSTLHKEEIAFATTPRRNVDVKQRSASSSPRKYTGRHGFHF